MLFIAGDAWESLVTEARHMTTNTPALRRQRHYVIVHKAAMVVAMASGTFALVAMLFGSPASFGLALALCGAAWIVTHFVEYLTEQDAVAVRSRRQRSTRRATGSLRLTGSH
ncbi:hypothetical protein GR927_23010 [Mycolicibacterium sp. 3033]|nr:hypothetical protein [Mycolicibacterium aurantiacum]